MKFSYSQTSFKSGRLSPKLVQRIDTEQYKDGCSILEGMKVLPEGGAERVKGTRVIAVDNVVSLPAGFGTGPMDIKQFSLLIGTTPVLFQIYESFPSGGNTGGTVFLYAYKFNGYSLSSIGSITLVPASATVRTEADLFDYAYINGTLVITHFSGRIAPIYIVLDKTTPSLFTATINSMEYAGGFITSFPSDYRRYPISDIGNTGTTLALALVSGTTVSLTGTAADIAKMQIAGWVYLEATGTHNFGDGVSRTFVISGWHSVISKPSATVANVQCNIQITGQNPLLWAGVSSVQLWAYSLWGPNDWPRTVCAHEGRIVFGGTPTNPLGVYGSQVNNSSHFNQIRLPKTGTELLTINGATFGDTLVTDPYLFTIASDEDARIHFMKSMGSLVIGTDRKEWIANGGDNSILSPLTVNFKPQSTQGSVPLSAISAGKGIYYRSNDGHRIFSFRYNEANGSLMSIETSLLMGDILEEDPAVELCWAPHIQSVLVLLKSGRVFGIMDTGSEKGMAIYDTNLLAITALCFVDTGVTDTKYARGQSVSLYSGVFGNLTWEQTYYEYGLSNSYITKLGTTDANAYLFLDNVMILDTQVASGVKATNFNSNIGLGGVDYAFDNTGFILVHKALYPDGKLVFVNYATKQTAYFTATTWQTDDSDGTGQYWIVTDTTINSWNKMLVGKLQTPCKVATMNIEAGQQWGSAQMGVKNIDTIGIRHYKTYSYEISSDNVNWQEVVVADTVGQATNGREDRKFTSSPRYDQVVYLRNTKAEPCTILGINMRGVSNDG